MNSIVNVLNVMTQPTLSKARLWNECRKNFNSIFNMELNIVDETKIPWIEKYRPSKFDDIVLEPYNRQFFRNIIEGQSSYFPNLLLYGPPGTGKTTSIINFIQELQSHQHTEIAGNPSKSLSSLSNVIHLNASDERGIDIIRHQINLFISSSNLFDHGIKFVILDEVDYMTKLAQHALKYILQTCTFKNVRFFLICNYISKIDESLQREFICIQFNQLPRQDMYRFLHRICVQEAIEWSPRHIETLIDFYHCDIRSMINFLQLNQQEMMNETILQTLHEKYQLNNPDEVIRYIRQLSLQLNIHENEIIKKYLARCIQEFEGDDEEALSHLIDFADILIHNLDNPMMLELFTCRGTYGFY